eukprot:7512386-Pyramimonas_sp.AAC.1
MPSPSSRRRCQSRASPIQGEKPKPGNDMIWCVGGVPRTHHERMHRRLLALCWHRGRCRIGPRYCKRCPVVNPSACSPDPVPRDHARALKHPCH